MKLKPKADWSDAEVARFNEFMAATKGVPTYTVARAMWLVTPGTDWRGCTKSVLAEMWVKGCRFSQSAKYLNRKPIGSLRAAIAKATGGAE